MKPTFRTTLLPGSCVMASLAFLSCLALCSSVQGDVPAFPGAEGFGAFSVGGRGGKVLHVTTLEDGGEGSLRWAVDQEGPRTIVFDVSGTIELKDRLTLKNPYITIAGQTAPGDGICLRGQGVSIAADHVIIRYLRLRLGDEGDGEDALNLGKGEQIIVDHCSASWSLDEVLSASTKDPGLTNITVQWCYITEALNPKGHGFGSLIRGAGGAKYSYLYNLYAHNRGRNPRPGNYDDHPYDKDPDGLLLDFRNNVIYNWGGGHAGYNADKVSVTKLNYVGNYLLPGKDSQDNGIAYQTGSPYNRGFFSDNMFNRKLPSNQWEIVKFNKQWSSDTIEQYKQSRPFETGHVQLLDASTAYELVLESGGASLPKRDPVDQRIVADVRNGTGGIIKSQKDVGGWPELSSTSPALDSDQDGMPDSWEQQFQLDLSNPGDSAADLDKDGYTNLEEFLNGTDPTVYVDYHIKL